MKKMVLATAVAASFAGFAVESATVGYDTFNLVKGQKILKAMNFQTVGGEAIDLQDLVAKNGTSVADEGNFNIWWWDTTTGNKYATWRSYYWDNMDPAADEDGYVWLDDGDFVWTDLDDDAPTKWVKSFSSGEGFFMQPTAATPRLTVSGGIKGSNNTTDAYQSMSLTKGQKKLVSSPFPASVDLQDIVALDGTAVADEGNFTIWWWDTTTGNKYATWRSYYWDNTDPDADEDGYVWLDEGDFVWTDLDDDAPTKWEKTFGVGEGFFTQPTAAKPVLMFPNPFKQ